MRFSLRSLACMSVLAGALLAGCSGSRTSAIPSSAALQSNKTVTASLTISIGGAGTQVAKRGTQSIPATSSKSLIIKYLGDPSPTNAPTNPFNPPSTAATVTIGSTPYMNINTGTGGNCTTVGSSLQCTITGLILPVGTIDLYVLDYDTAQTSSTPTGNLIYAAVLPVTVSASATIVNANTLAAPTITLSGNDAATGASVAFSLTSLGISPVGAAIATASPFAYSSPVGITAKDANGNTITGTLSPVTVSLNDTTGSVCLAYVSAATLSASPSATPTPCTAASVGSTPASVTISNTADQVYVQYNNRPVTLATAAPFALTLANPAPSGTPSSIPITFTGNAFATAAPNAVTGAVLNYNGTVYIAEGSGLAPSAAIVPFTLTNGKLTASSATLPSTAKIGYGGGATPTTSSTLSGQVVGMTIGPDGNIWFVEQNGTSVYVGVYAVAASASNGLISQGTVAETSNIGTLLTSGNDTVTGITTQNGYVWITDTASDVVRVNPASLNGTFANDTTGTGIVAIEAGALSSSGAGTGVGLSGVPSPAPGLAASGTSNIVWPAASPSARNFIKVIPLPSPTATAGGSFFTGTSNDFSTSGLTSPVSKGGILLDSTGTGNYWTAAGISLLFGNGTFGAAISIPSNDGVGGIAQESLDNAMFTWLSSAAGNLVQYSTVTGTYKGTFGPATGSTGPGPTGTSLVGVGNYLIGTVPGATTSPAIYVIVP